jgi:hypothetical protein
MKLGSFCKNAGDHRQHLRTETDFGTNIEVGGAELILIALRLPIDDNQRCDAIIAPPRQLQAALAHGDLFVSPP